MHNARDFAIERYTSAQLAQIIGRKGQVSVDTTNSRVVVHDGVTAGGIPEITPTSTDTLTNKTLTAPTITEAKLTNGVTFSKTSGVGIKLDETSPTFGWRDLTSDIQARATGGNNPTFAVYGGYTGLYQYSFDAATMQQVWCVFHVPHDYVPGTDIHFHAHWSNAAASPAAGGVTWGFEYTFARGFDQAAFPTPTIVRVTQAASTVRYRHMVAETAAVTIAGMEVDGLILVRIFRDVTDGGDTLTDPVFLHTADIHFKSTGFLTTKNKAPNFYA